MWGAGIRSSQGQAKQIKKKYFMILKFVIFVVVLLFLMKFILALKLFFSRFKF